MSGLPCTCGRKHGDYSDFVVVQYKHHYSAFSGYHRTYSDYSTVVCIRKGCSGMRRTKAAYVEELEHMSLEEAMRARGDYE